MPQPITLKEKIELIEKKLYGLDRSLLNGIEISLFQKGEVFKRVHYHGSVIQTYFYVENKLYPECYIGHGIQTLQKHLGVNKKTAILVYIAKLTELFNRIKEDEKFEDKSKILAELQEKIEKIIWGYPMPTYKKICSNCKREFKTKHQDFDLCSNCYYWQNQERTPEPKNQKPEPKNLCKRCNTPIPEGFEFCEVCRQILILKGKIRT